MAAALLAAALDAALDAAARGALVRPAARAVAPHLAAPGARLAAPAHLRGRRRERRRGAARTVRLAMSAYDAALPSTGDLTDPREWLEDIEGEDALKWVQEVNDRTVKAIGDPESSPLYQQVLDILDSYEKIPYIGRVLNGLYYNFWQDEKCVRGVWRRCTLEEYRKEEPNWEIVLDIDALGAEEGVSWVWAGSTLLDEGADVRKDRVMIRLSRGGADATVAREFDLDRKEFISPSEGGFELPEAKLQICYRDRDTLLVGGVFGDEELTDSGYARTVREWTRGSPLAHAELVFEGDRADVAASASAYIDRGVRYELRTRALTFYTSTFELSREGDDFARVQVPEDAELSTFGDHLLITLRSGWLQFPAGTLLTAHCADFMAAEGKQLESLLRALFVPSDSSALLSSDGTKNYLVLTVLDNVVTELRFWKLERGEWSLERTFKEVGLAQLGVAAVNAEENDLLWLTVDGYTQPTTLSLIDASMPDERTQLKTLPAFFNATGLHTQQLRAISADGTEIPYFLVSREGIPLDGSTPTLLYGYGGFEISLTPSYAAGVGVAWLEKGYAYVQANIRGGGEFGPRWHQAALKEKRHKAYEDFEAVAQDLISRGITSPAKLGCMGGSNGGLLTGNMLVRSPKLFGAIVCQVPLLDMQRFHTLLAGASWIGEYGNPETDWAYLQTYSPYHNVQIEVDYPPFLCTTSTRDDRVHPGHARKFVHKLLELRKPTYYYENIEGGHGGAADNKQRAFKSVLEFSFLERELTRSVLPVAAPPEAVIKAAPPEAVIKATLPALEKPMLLQGGSLRTWSYRNPAIEQVQLFLSSEGRPFEADIELWHGPDNTPCKVRVYVENGFLRPFSTVIETPRGPNTVAIRNIGELEFPFSSSLVAQEVDSPTEDCLSSALIIQGGAIRTFPFESSVESVQVLLMTDGRPLNSRIELLQGPNNVKIVIDVYTEDGRDRPFYCLLMTPGSGNVVRVVNTAPVEFPMSASVVPLSVNMYLAGGPNDVVIGGDLSPTWNITSISTYGPY